MVRASVFQLVFGAGRLGRVGLALPLRERGGADGGAAGGAAGGVGGAIACGAGFESGAVNAWATSGAVGFGGMDKGRV